MTVADRATSLHGLLKALALVTLDTYSLSRWEWRTADDIAAGMGQSARDDVPGSARASLLVALGRWSGRYQVATRRHVGIWPKSWRLVEYRRREGKPYEYKLSKRGAAWLKHSLARVEAKCGLSPGSIRSEVTARLGVAACFRIERNYHKSEWWGIFSPFDTEGGCVRRLVEPHERYLIPGSRCVIGRDNAYDAAELIETRLGVRICDGLRRSIEAENLGVRWVSRS